MGMGVMDPWHHASMPCARPWKYQGHVSSARRRSPAPARAAPASPNKYLPPSTRVHPLENDPPTRGSRETRRPHVSDTGAPRGPPLVPLRWNNAAAPPPPPASRKIFSSPLLAPRCFSLLPPPRGSASAPPPAAKSAHGRRRLAAVSLGLERATSR